MSSIPPLHGRIRDWLELRFGQNAEPGTRINEAELAEELRVSRTPVRKVLKQLQAEGVVEYIQHKGFRLVKPDRLSPTCDGISDLLDERMMRDMALGEFSAPMSERALMHRYDVPHGALTSTLRRLMRDQLVEPSAGRGWIFADVGPVALENSYRFRQIIEPAAILSDSFEPDTSAFKALDEEHASAIANIQKIDRRRLFDLDAKFHRQVALSVKTSYMADTIDRQNNIRRVNEYVGAVRIDRLRNSMLEHRGIIEAILGHEGQLAAALMRVHLQLSREETFRHMDEDLERIRSGHVSLAL